MQLETTTKPQLKAVYSIQPKSDGKDFWMRIGTAFPNRDGSLTVLLDALPLGSRLQIRDTTPRENANPRASSPEQEA